MKVVLYHDNCQDGLFAAFAAWTKFGADALYIPVNYAPLHSLSPQDALAHVFSEVNCQRSQAAGNSRYRVSAVTASNYADIDLIVVDFSFPVAHFMHHLQVFKSVLVLDHHHSSLQAYSAAYNHSVQEYGWKYFFPADNATVVFSEKESGAKLAWMYFHPHTEVPKYIEHVSDRDLWTFKLPSTKEFHVGCQALRDENFARLEGLVNTEYRKILQTGETLLKEVERRIESTKQSLVLPTRLRLNGQEHRCALVNAPADITSDLGNSLIRDGYDVAVVYNIKPSKQVGCGVRSRAGVDGSLLAAHYGGGGHQQAAGFSLDLPTLVEILNAPVWEVGHG